PYYLPHRTHHDAIVICSWASSIAGSLLFPTSHTPLGEIILLLGIVHSWQPPVSYFAPTTSRMRVAASSREILPSSNSSNTSSIEVGRTVASFTSTAGVDVAGTTAFTARLTKPLKSRSRFASQK